MMTEEMLNLIRQDLDKTSIHCVDCGLDVRASYYMVKNEVWNEAGYDKKDSAHSTCLSKRLGRKLTVDDFIFVPVNDVVHSIDPNLPILNYKELLESKKENKK